MGEMSIHFHFRVRSTTQPFLVGSFNGRPQIAEMDHRLPELRTASFPWGALGTRSMFTPRVRSERTRPPRQSWGFMRSQPPPKLLPTSRGLSDAICEYPDLPQSAPRPTRLFPVLEGKSCRLAARMARYHLGTWESAISLLGGLLRPASDEARNNPGYTPTRAPRNFRVPRLLPGAGLLKVEVVTNWKTAAHF